MIKKNQGLKSISISIVPGMNVNQIFYSDVSKTGILEKFAGTITFCFLLFSSMHKLNPVSKKQTIFMKIKLQQTQKEKNHDFIQ